MMTTSELRSLSEDDLFRYFTDRAGYQPEAPPESRYTIRVGSKSVFAHDTDVLRDKFFAAVREGTT